MPTVKGGAYQKQALPRVSSLTNLVDDGIVGGRCVVLDTVDHLQGPLRFSGDTVIGLVVRGKLAVCPPNKI